MHATESPQRLPQLPQLRLMLLGATGVVGSHLLSQALSHPQVQSVVAPTRRPLPMRAKLVNPVIDFSHLPTDEPWWQVDAVVCALGTTLRAAGSPAAFVQVDHDWPVQMARLAKRTGATRFALNSSLGANALSGNLYLRTKGQVEDDIRAIEFARYTIVRPSLINVRRSQIRPGEAFGLFVARLLQPVIPKKYRPVSPDRIARALLAGALAPQTGEQVIESGQLQP